MPLPLYGSGGRFSRIFRGKLADLLLVEAGDDDLVRSGTSMVMPSVSGD